MPKKKPYAGRNLNVIPTRLKSKIDRIRNRAKSAKGGVSGARKVTLTSIREKYGESGSVR